LGKPTAITERVVGKVTTSPVEAAAGRADFVAFVRPNEIEDWTDWHGYAGAISTGILPPLLPMPTVEALPNLDYLEDGDVILLQPSGQVRVLYRRGSLTNSILTTERCNSYCLMCSQPPKDIDDSWRVPVILRLIELIDPDTRDLILSGGEPTLLGDSFFEIVAKCASYLPETALHVLTNGRRFQDPSLALRLGSIGHPDLMLGIPLYSDIDRRHDYVVQAKGAWAETLRGVYHLASAGVRLELRVVLHRQTYDRLPQLAEFIYRNLPFVEHVALMGLEMFGFTNQNLPVLWIDPVDYMRHLEEATTMLAVRGMNVSIYNHQLCTIPRSLWPFARKSISDWKNVYLAACEQCGVRDYCGGFFQSATKRHSAHIHALPVLSTDAERAMRALAGLEEPLEEYMTAAHR
jgi:His-Xaa-Ser system radical SAM maturase HxsC